jgi:hypothetical protein
MGVLEFRRRSIVRQKLIFWYVVFGIWFVTLFVPILEYRKPPDGKWVIEVWVAYQFIWESLLARNTTILLIAAIVALIHTATAYLIPRSLIAVHRWFLELGKKSVRPADPAGSLSLRTRRHRFPAGHGNL